jgi:hypothetical protein
LVINLFGNTISRGSVHSTSYHGYGMIQAVKSLSH